MSKKLDEIEIDPNKMEHIEKGIPQPYFGIIFALIIIIFVMLFVSKFGG